MRKTFLMALMAAVAMTPAIASAQDRGRGERGDGQRASSQPARPGPQRSSNGGGNGGARPQGNWNRGNFQPRPAPSAPQASRPQPQGQFRGGGWNGNGLRDGNPGAVPGRDNAVNAGNRWRQNQSAPDATPNAAGRGPRGNDGRWNGDRGPGGNDGRWNGGARPGGGDGRWNGNRPPRGNDGRWDGNRPPQGNDGRWNDRGPGRNDGRWNGSHRQPDYGWRGGSGRGGAWNRNWRGSNRYDWQHYRSSNRNAFHLPRYYAPYGWNHGYRRFSIGMMLDSMLFANSYWIDDPYDYRLPEAYGEYRWVRYYNDALLVDVYTGEVVDVVYDIFW